MAVPGTLKRLGHGLYKLWLRCDMCEWSGPFEQFTVVVNHDFDEDAAICDECARHDDLWQALFALGWRPRT
jgi:hypothetical protein